MFMESILLHTFSIPQGFNFFFLVYCSETLYNLISHIRESIHRVSRATCQRIRIFYILRSLLITLTLIHIGLQYFNYLFKNHLMTILQVRKIRQWSVNSFLIWGCLVADICGKVWGTSQLKKPIYFRWFGDPGQDLWVSCIWGYQQRALVSSELNFLTLPMFLSWVTFCSVADEMMGTLG